MAVPSTSYLTKELNAGKASGRNTFSEIRKLFVAKFLQNTTAQSGDDWGDGYFNSTDTDAEKRTKIKDIFKLDVVAIIEEGGGQKHFVGGCFSRTTGNGAYHNWDNNTSPYVARGSGAKLPTTVNANCELLNDSGLNTLGTINLGLDTYITSDLANNGFKLTATYRGSYYNGADSYGIKWRKQGDSVYNTKVINSLLPKEKKVLIKESIDIDPLDILYIEAPNTYETQAFITNSEGTKIIQMLNVTVTPLEITLRYGVTLANAYLYGTDESYYLSKRIAEGGTLYANSTATIPVSTGYYMAKIGNAPYLYYKCDNNGVIIGSSEYDPSVARVLYKPSGWGDTLSNALVDANSTNWAPKYTIYLDPNDDKWYANNVGTTLALDGYWLIGDSDLSYEEIYLINGIQQ